MMKASVMLVASASATSLTSTSLTSSSHPNLISTDTTHPNLIATDNSTQIQALGAWSEQTTCAAADIT
jgi:hypothetical protein